jgi:hypothetical protein
MSDSSGFRWGVGLLVSIVGVAIGYASLRHQMNEADEPDDPATWTDDPYSYDDQTVAAGGWEQTGTLQLDLPSTFADGHCWTWGIDLDDGGSHELVGEGDEYSDWVDASWYSCRTDTPAIFYGPQDSSITTDAGESQLLDDCAAQIGENTYLELWLDPENPTTDEGCLYTTEGAFATVLVDSQTSDGTYDTGRITVTFWAWTG